MYKIVHFYITFFVHYYITINTISLGNETSQAFGLIYLYKLIHFIKEKLNIKYVVSYMDDLVILHNNKNYLRKCLNVIEIKLNKEFKLKINKNKTRIDNINNGIDFLGYRFIIKNNKVILKVRNRIKKRFKKKINELNILYINSIISRKEYLINISSYKGIMKYGSCNYIYYKNVKIF